MSIATEIQRLQTAKNDIKTAIENKGVTVGDGLIDTYAEKINEISSGGGDNKFWDVYLKNGERTYYLYAFSYEGWTDETFKPIHDMHPTNADHMFFQTSITDLKGILERQGVVLDTSKVPAMPQTFFNTQITHIPILDVSSCTNFGQAFRNSGKIVSIGLENIRKDATWGYAFYFCSSLTDFYCTGTIGKSIEFPHCGLLSDESLQNIVDCLADLTGETTQTLTLYKTVGEKLTDTQKATITAKNWTLAY